MGISKILWDKAFNKNQELPVKPTTLIRLKHIVVDGVLFRRINGRRDKVRGNHYVSHFRVRYTHSSKQHPEKYMGVINLGEVLLPKELVGKLVKIDMRIFDDRILPEKPTFLKEKDVLENFHR